uniref:Uncharacterized protein n=1 Tax=Anguilla anguilla TaxID=7936 RepID=A0A0E9QLX0_ANGAN
MCSHSVYVCMCNGGCEREKRRELICMNTIIFPRNFISDLSACLNVHYF